MVEQDMALAPVDEDLQPVTDVVEAPQGSAQEAPTTGDLKKCAHCDYEYGPSPPFAYANHIKRAHPDQTRKVKKSRARQSDAHDGSAPATPAPTGAAPAPSGPERARTPDQTPRSSAVAPATADYLASLSPLAHRLHEAATRVLGASKAPLVRQMVTIYERNTQVLGDRHRFRSWGVRYGLTTDQLAQIEDDIFGLDDAGPGAGFPGGMSQPVWGTGPNGMPVIYIQGPGAAEAPLAAAPIIMSYPQGPQAYRSLEADAVRDELRELRSELRLLTRERQGSGQAQMRRVPMMDEGGELVTDVHGNILYQEVPHDPQAGTLELLRTAFTFAQGAGQGGPAFDEEKQALQIEKAVRDATPASTAKAELPEEVRAHIDELRAKSMELVGKVSSLEKEKEIEGAVERAIAPFAAELRESRAAQGLSEAQYAMQHKERMADNARDLVTGLFDGLRGDLRPLMMQQVAAQLKAAGVSDEVVASAVQGMTSSAQVSSNSPVRTKISDARDRWVKKG